MRVKIEFFYTDERTTNYVNERWLASQNEAAAFLEAEGFYGVHESKMVVGQEFKGRKKKGRKDNDKRRAKIAKLSPSAAELAVQRTAEIMKEKTL